MKRQDSCGKSSAIENKIMCNTKQGLFICGYGQGD